MKKFYIIATIATAILAAGGAKENFEEVKQSSRLNGGQAAELVEADPEFLNSYISGLYSWLVQFDQAYEGHDDFGLASIFYITDVMGQDIVFGGQHWGMFDYTHQYWGQQYVRPRQIWSNFYTLIANANEIIGMIDSNTNIEKFSIMSAAPSIAVIISAGNGKNRR